MNNGGSKSIVFYGVFVLVGLIYIARLFTLQIDDSVNYEKALRNGSNEITVYPDRGIIFDRNGKLIVYNDAVYDLVVIPEKVKVMDTALLCSVLKIDRNEFIARLAKASEYSRKRAEIFYKNLASDVNNQLQEMIYQFPAFYIEKKTDRKYKINGSAHILGYLSEVTPGMIKKDPYYRSGDIKGIAGMENSYEFFLRGKKGVKMIYVDKLGLEQGSMGNGMFDTAAIPGENITSSIDLSVQELGEQLLANKIGSIVALEPSTGEVLALVNSPGYDPNLLVGQIRNKNYPKLVLDPRKPLFNRALKAKYPPGSTFKTVQALIGQQEGVLTPETTYPCSRGYHMGSITVGCHAHASPLNLTQSITKSCNAYYCYTYRSIIDNPKYPSVQAGFEKWTLYLNSFGIGVQTGIDLPEESRGNVPTVKYYNKVFGENWRSSNVVSLSIGQGEMGLTPLQMANVAAIIANKGFWYTPHVVKSIGDKKYMPESFQKRHQTIVDSQYFRPVIEGMAGVCKPGGTAGGAAIPGIEICAKTGTAQNPHGEDHSIFIAFAPRINPKIAICVIVENGGFGATYAAPIATLMIEKYLNGDTGKTKKPEMLKRILNAKLIQPSIYDKDTNLNLVQPPPEILESNGVPKKVLLENKKGQRNKDNKSDHNQDALAVLTKRPEHD
ncbi:MAG: penicillin-binding protein 2 [Bacteroidia bacterium]|nr:penicillin-binding protein 2 [Bacteroidia bacterium]